MLIELPRRGRLILVTDLHGDIDLFKRIMEKSKLMMNLGMGNYFVCCGDFIHSYGKRDKSIELVETMIHLKSRYPKNVFILLGNHEWSHIIKTPVFKGDRNLYREFLDLMGIKFEFKHEEKMKEYTRFFKSLPIAVKASNLFVSHAAPDKLIELSDFKNFTAEKVLTPRDKFYALLWARPSELDYSDAKYSPYDEEDIEYFLEEMHTDISIVGHTPVLEPYRIGKQLIIHTASKGHYLELDLSKRYTMEELMNCVNIA
ncbi:MAG: metallophosphoesterase family protein [Candidatus Aenigmatarchaeota archaeon]